jgi:hypothetical protein
MIPIFGIKSNGNKVEKVKERKVFREYKILLDPDEADKMEEFAQSYCMTYTGCFRRGVRLMIELEKKKNEIVHNYQNSQKMATIK